MPATYRNTVTSSFLTRRTLFAQTFAAAMLAACRGAAQTEPESSPEPEAEGTPFSFDWLADRQRESAGREWVPPPVLDEEVSGLDYDAYRQIQFRPDHARWSGPKSRVVLHGYHPGWLFDRPVRLNEIVDGTARPMRFTGGDFRYGENVAQRFPDDFEFPGVAGFRLNAPVNSPDRFDEVVSFLGASYFRALGKGNVYGLSARGLALNTAIGGEEEFPFFSEFWIERPEPGTSHVVFYAALESPSVAGAYRFAITPGETTTIDVEQRLFFRNDVRQLGIAPLTSMFLFAPNDVGPFHDYRERVHDSEALIVDTSDHRFFRPLSNPETLANSYVGANAPTAFGLVQRNRAFEDYLDAHAYYEKRPSLIVEPVGDWGRGAVRLIEIPTDLESNDNIVAFWVPEAEVQAGDAREFSYRLHWGMAPLGSDTQYARVLRTLTGFGGVAGINPQKDRQKFVIDFDAERMTELDDDTPVEEVVSAVNGEIVETILERLEEPHLWRLVIEVRATGPQPVELKADLQQGNRRLTETWLYQWKKN